MWPHESLNQHKERDSHPSGPSLGSSWQSERGSTEDKNLTACILVMTAQRSHSFIIILLRGGSICFCLPFVKSDLFLWIVEDINFPEMVPWWIGVHAARSVFIDKRKVNWMFCVYGVCMLRPAELCAREQAGSLCHCSTSGDWREGRFFCVCVPEAVRRNSYQSSVMRHLLCWWGLITCTRHKCVAFVVVETYRWFFRHRFDSF